MVAKNVEWTGFLIEGWKFHFVPNSLLGGILQDANRRGHTNMFVQEPRDEGEIDLGGMLMMGRSGQEVTVDGFTLNVPSQDFKVFHEELRNSRLRNTIDGLPYYKIHGAYCCVVFTPEQRLKVLAVWDQVAEQAEADAEADHEEFLRRLDQVNKDGLKVVSVRDPKYKIEKKEDGSISIKQKIEVPGVLSGTPSNSKN